MSLINVGSVDDIRCSLKLISPGNETFRKYDLRYLRKEGRKERKGQNRSTVIKMIRSKINNIEKMKFEL
jgi:hypothetical protein